MMRNFRSRLNQIEGQLFKGDPNDPRSDWQRCQEEEIFRKFPWALQVYLIADKPWSEWTSDEIRAAWGFDCFVSYYFKRYFEIDLVVPPSREDKDYKCYWMYPNGLDEIPTLEAQGMWSSLGIYQFFERYQEYVETRLARRSEEQPA